MENALGKTVTLREKFMIVSKRNRCDKYRNIMNFSPVVFFSLKLLGENETIS